MKEQRKNRICQNNYISISFHYPSIILVILFSLLLREGRKIINIGVAVIFEGSTGHHLWIRLNVKTRKKGKLCPLLYFRLAYLSPSVAYYAGWWFIGASRSLTSDLWMKIRARVAWATRRTATREIDRHYYSRCLVNMSIMLRETSGTRKNVHSFDLSLSRVALCVCCNCSNQIPFFSLLFLLIFSYYYIPGKSNPDSFGFKNCDDVERCNLLEIQFTLTLFLGFGSSLMKGGGFFFFMFLNVISYL